MVVGEAAKTVAWLHDVLAETDYTAVELRQFFPEDVVRAMLVAWVEEQKCS
jgi:(p)ppGpp synthase/HD superfamily hydrolase